MMIGYDQMTIICFMTDDPFFSSVPNNRVFNDPLEYHLDCPEKQIYHSANNLLNDQMAENV